MSMMEIDGSPAWSRTGQSALLITPGRERMLFGLVVRQGGIVSVRVRWMLDVRRERVGCIYGDLCVTMDEKVGYLDVGPWRYVGAILPLSAVPDDSTPFGMLAKAVAATPIGEMAPDAALRFTGHQVADNQFGVGLTVALTGSPKLVRLSYFAETSDSAGVLVPGIL